MPVIKDDKILLIRCKCHGHILEITYDDYWIEEGVEPDFYVSVWNQSPCPLSFSYRLKLVWDLIRGKDLSGDDVIIEKADAQSIVNFLNKQIRANYVKQKKNKGNAIR
jgi:hypothetical protein